MTTGDRLTGRVLPVQYIIQIPPGSTLDEAVAALTKAWPDIERLLAEPPKPEKFGLGNFRK